MKFEKAFKFAGIICILLAGLAGITSATTITVGGGQITSVGGQLDIPVILDSAPTGLSFYQITVASADPSVANIVKVTYPSWATLNSTGSLPAGSVGLIAIDLGHANPPGASNILLATLTVSGLKTGSTQLVVTSNSLGDPSYHESPAGAVVPGTIQVNGAVPTTTTVVPTTTTVVPTTTTVVPTTVVTTESTTTVPTTEPTTQPTTVITTEATTVVPTTEVTTVIPTTAPYTGPTGQVFLSTTPQGAQITLDGVPSNGITPIIMTISVGTHTAILKHAGYDEVEANFEVKTNAMTTVSKRLSPGSSVIPTTPVTTVVTTIPTTTVTQTTTIPTIVPTTIPGIWSYKMILPSWLTKILPFNWG